MRHKYRIMWFGWSLLTLFVTLTVNAQYNNRVSSLLAMAGMLLLGAIVIYYTEALDSIIDTGARLFQLPDAKIGRLNKLKWIYFQRQQDGRLLIMIFHSEKFSWTSMELLVSDKGVWYAPEMNLNFYRSVKSIPPWDLIRMKKLCMELKRKFLA